MHMRMVRRMKRTMKMRRMKLRLVNGYVSLLVLGKRGRQLTKLMMKVPILSYSAKTRMMPTRTVRTKMRMRKKTMKPMKKVILAIHMMTKGPKVVLMWTTTHLLIV